MGLAVGDEAPGFSLAASGGRVVSLADYAGRPFVMYFYPKADTPGCTKEACAFQEALGPLGAIGIDVIGVSRDKVAALDRFAAKYGLGFPLASDPETAVIAAYGAWGEKILYGRKYMGIERRTVLVGADGRVAQIWPKVKVAGHAAAVLAAARAL
jgi:thioredoxin-dependent peroxiredoxin